ncbi:hypothetical protein MRB53_041730 [Persea americana]|nr:hypothetical protein MRB53_041730 [Persea americana]
MAPSSFQGSQSIYLLPLADNGTPDIPGGHNYIYLPPPSEPAYLLRFVIEGTSSICREGTLFTNIPLKGEEFERSKYQEFKLKPDFNRTIQIDVPITQAGAFAFYTTYTPLPEFSTKSVPSPAPTRTKTFNVDVSPRLSLNGSNLPINALSICSILSKGMGKNPSDWDKHLRGIGQRGYNMIHFTPLMQRGISNSPYSIYDQLGFDKNDFPNGESDVTAMIEKMEHEFGLLGLTDIVLNHTANNSKWLESHPEAGYNIETAPWLESAEELDLALGEFGAKLASYGLPTTLNNTDDLSKVTDSIKSKVIGGIKLWEWYVVDVERDTKVIMDSWRGMNETLPAKGDLKIENVQSWSLGAKADWIVDHALTGNDRLGERFRRRVVPDIAASIFTAQFGSFSKHPDENRITAAVKDTLNEVNERYYKEYDAEVAVIMDQLYNRIKYMRIDDHGPKLGPITDANPLVEPYFTRLPVNETTKGHNPRSLALVNNGWIWAADAMKDNAGPSSRAYLRREVIIWGDCVKLRYGAKAEDSPFLWDFMARYARMLAKHFVGFRIDNCHSTPIHVAEYMLDQARKIRPNLAIFAELFSGSESMDFVFVQRLGISALIREAMQAGSTAEISKLVHVHGGAPIGSFELDEVYNADNDADGVNGTSPTTRQILHKIGKSDVHALLFDCTHDNEPPAQKRDARDTLPNAALVAMCACSTGSVMGYDEVYPKIIDLVQEKRLYTSISSTSPVSVQAGEGGIGGIKKLLNQIHVVMGKDGYSETYIDHKDEYVTVHRVHPQSRKGYFLIAHTAYPGYGNGNGGFAPVRLSGTKAKSLGAWRLQVDDSQDAKAALDKEPQFLKGLPSRTVEIRGITVESAPSEAGEAHDETVISIPETFPPGSIALFETWVPSAEHAEGLDKYVTSGARAAFKELKLRDLNFVLYRCDPEEHDITDGKDGCYSIPGHGTLVYAGLQGWWSVLRDIVRDNNLGHPLCQHLREGQWALDYCVNRLDHIAKIEGYERIKSVAQWLRQRFDAIRKIPSFLLPRYFAMVIQTAYNAARDRAVEQMGDDVQHGPPFLKSLAMVSVQMSGYMKSTSLYPKHSVPCLAAGLPHFASDWARCWGRDVFISLRGLLLSTGRFMNAREHILAFASVLKHGMIPNLLGSGKITRYNSRDSIWFFLQNIQDYTKMAPNGLLILKDSTKRRFLPNDDTWFPWDDPRAYSTSSTVEDVIQEALQRHASGMSFREANAGPSIDSQMKDQGFNIEVHVDWKTGLIFGGNQFNCGTWMVYWTFLDLAYHADYLQDKMMESEKAGTKGFPATPRNGAAVEITGMLYSTLTWVAAMHERGQYKYEGVKMSGSGDFITFKDWATKIKQNFERCYYIPLDPSKDGEYDVNSKIINRRGIYKDLYRSSKEYEDYQLRANFPIAMTVAPDLFVPEHALHALSVYDAVLVQKYGIATLDPSDNNYRPFYLNSDDSYDAHIAKGASYHSGPPWLWPRGYFLRALLKFSLLSGKDEVETLQQLTQRMMGCKEMIETSPWAGLAELTQGDDSECHDACPTQAWSASCLIDVFTDAAELSKSH